MGAFVGANNKRRELHEQRRMSMSHAEMQKHFGFRFPTVTSEDRRLALIAVELLGHQKALVKPTMDTSRHLEESQLHPAAASPENRHEREGEGETERAHTKCTQT